MTTQVPIKNGGVLNVGELGWDGWILLKREVMGILSDDSTQNILSIILGEIQGSGDNVDYKDLAPAIPRLIGLFLQVVDNNTLYLAECCIEEELDPPLEKRKLKAPDVLSLREAVLKENDFMELLKMEGNSFLAAIPESHRESAEQIFSQLVGGFNGNQSSPAPTDGPPVSTAS